MLQSMFDYVHYQLELDAKIMDKLQDLRVSLAYAADENTGSVGENLLNSSVQG